MTTSLLELINRRAPLHEVNAYLVQNPSAILERDISLSTGLHEAVERGDLELVGLLIRFGAEVNAQTESFITPLHVACHYGYLAIAELLIQEGACIDMKDGFHNKPLEYCFPPDAASHLRELWQERHSKRA